MKLIKDSLIYLGGELFAKALPFLLLPYLTRALGAAGYGTLSYWQTLAAVLFLAVNLVQDGAVSRYFYVYGRHGLGRIVAAGYLYTAILTALLLLFAYTHQSLILAAVTLSAAAQSVFSVQLSLRQCQKQALSYTLIQTASGLATSLLTVWLLEYTQGDAVQKRFWALFAGQAAVSAVAFYWASGSLKLHFGRRSLQRSLVYLLSLGAPLLLHQLSNLIKGQLDRFVLFRHYSAEEVGIYAAGFQLASVLAVLLLAANKAAVPYFFQHLKSGRFQAADVRRWAWFSLLLAPLAPLPAAVLPESVYVWLLGNGYAGVKPYVCAFLFGSALTLPYLVLVNFLFYHGRNRKIAALSLCSAAVYALVLLAAVHIGIAYAPLAMICSNAVMLLLLFAAVKD